MQFACGLDRFELPMVGQKDYLSDGVALEYNYPSCRPMVLPVLSGVWCLIWQHRGIIKTSAFVHDGFRGGNRASLECERLLARFFSGYSSILLV